VEVSGEEGTEKASMPRGEEVKEVKRVDIGASGEIVAWVRD